MTIEARRDAPVERPTRPRGPVATPVRDAVPPGARDRLRHRIAVLRRLEVLRFGLVGAANTAVDLGVYLLLSMAGLPVLLANFVSTSAGLGFSFVANRRFTFSARPSDGAGRQLLLFVVCTGVGLWVVQPVVLLGAGHLLAPVGGPEEVRVLLAKLAAIGCGMVWNWTLYNRVVFRVAPAAGQPAARRDTPAAQRRDLRPRP